MDATRLLALQSTSGNAAVVQMLRLSGYPYAQSPSVQRTGQAQEQHAHGADCGHQHSVPGGPAVQRSAVHAVLRSGGSPLGSAIRSEMEARLGADFSDVRIHTDSAARASAAEVGARAYTSGSHVVIGEGGADKHTLAHELTHVIQQRSGPVAGTTNGAGLKVSDPNDRFEREAEANAHRVLAGPVPTAQGREDGSASPRQAAQAPVQRATGPTPAGAPTVQRAVTHDHPIVNSDHRAQSVEVHNIAGKPLGPSANQPTVDTFGWQELRQAGHTLGNRIPGVQNSHYNAVRMHLWNGRLGGPGDKTYNLAPGPAVVNSSMSAGPEMSAKNAVEQGETIWLHTWVQYRNSSNVANDFASVIPSDMWMEWGLMQNSTTPGPRKEQWHERIDQPAGALTPAQQQVLQNVATPAALDALLKPVGQPHASKQEQAQAYELVPAALKPHMLINYPSIYQSFDTAARASVLCQLAPVDVLQLANHHGYLTAPRDFAEMIMSPLYSVPTQPHLQAIMRLVPRQDWDTVVLAAGSDCLAHLGDIGLELARTNMQIFKLCDPLQRIEAMDGMDAAGFQGLFADQNRSRYIDEWAMQRGGPTAGEREVFVRARRDANQLTPAMYTSYCKFISPGLREEERARGVAAGTIRTSGRR
ncbi:hypothetical protein DNK56_17840 [Streptomyces sp. AC1-42W]|uniref:eCIS core domain-containing protein n=1 Tax=unclassified Streptomyces TaxID=2593676 RepID=UPI000DABEC73|nr:MULTISPECIES: DUF4157 domain-containing protein [unclassified Streptomyces]PZT73344.1 hypothetical protein DNK55_13585 [Streptomyces sp. AC1-42T]PZT83667.1 hypothetical protein DNK56_17840 [Streptomyces sp. AC1-42W]